MELKLLDKEGLTALYQNEMTVDFPKSELKPLRAMLRLMDMGRYDPLLIVDGGKPVGYALAWLPEGREGALLEYFGVLRGLRNGGLGTKILTLLAERYGHISAKRRLPAQRHPLRRTACAAAALGSTSATASGCWTTSVPCSGCGSTACTGARRWTTGR